MALDVRKRQQKLAKKAAKRKAVLATKKYVGQGEGFLSHVGQTLPAADAPIHECLMPERLFDIGLGSVIVSRRLPNGFIDAAVFLVDVFCLGIKDAFHSRLSPAEYAQRLAHLQHETFKRDLEATACPEHFVFGKNGKPFFMSGPSDTPARCRRILTTLSRRCGPDGFHFVVAGGGPVPQW